jgi:hypothetical protein
MEEPIRQVVGVLCIWMLIGYFIAGAVPKPASKMSALRQTFWLGPLFWVGISLWGLCILAKRRFFTPK